MTLSRTIAEVISNIGILFDVFLILMFKLCADKFGPFFSFDVPHIGKTHRTAASIKALGAVAPSLICRNVYYAGAKHLLPILELLLPGIDLVSYH